MSGIAEPDCRMLRGGGVIAGWIQADCSSSESNAVGADFSADFSAGSSGDSSAGYSGDSRASRTGPGRPNTTAHASASGRSAGSHAVICSSN